MRQWENINRKDDLIGLPVKSSFLFCMYQQNRNKKYKYLKNKKYLY